MPKLLTVGIHKITSKSHTQTFQGFLYDSEDNQQLFQYIWPEKRMWTEIIFNWFNDLENLIKVNNIW